MKSLVSVLKRVSSALEYQHESDYMGFQQKKYILKNALNKPSVSMGSGKRPQVFIKKA